MAFLTKIQLVYSEINLFEFDVGLNSHWMQKYPNVDIEANEERIGRPINAYMDSLKKFIEDCDTLS